MNIIYLSSGCSEPKFAELVRLGYTKKLPQAQKYHNLLMEGLAESLDGTLTAIAAYPVNRAWTKKDYFPRECETVGKVNYVYCAFRNRLGLRQWMLGRGAKKEIKRLYKENRDCVIICDVLNHSLADAARAMGKRYGIPVIGIVTDVPSHSSGARRKTLSFARRLVSSYAAKTKQGNLEKYDAYLLLTEEMNAVVNPKSKPHIVIEGHSDAKMASVENTLAAKSTPRVAMYAGGIHREFGIERMVKAFLTGNFEGWELHIYGDGNYQTDLAAIAAACPSVKYFGSRPNSEVVAKQLEASLLLNPRLTDAEYVRYSFPSKTMECMASGTPLLTTRLPGMPREYYDYVSFFDDESEEGMLAAFREVLALSPEELHERGTRAKHFVMENKTNVGQAKRLLAFIADLEKKD